MTSKNRPFLRHVCSQRPCTGVILPQSDCDFYSVLIWSLKFTIYNPTNYYVTTRCLFISYCCYDDIYLYIYNRLILWLLLFNLTNEWFIIYYNLFVECALIKNARHKNLSFKNKIILFRINAAFIFYTFSIVFFPFCFLNKSVLKVAFVK